MVAGIAVCAAITVVFNDIGFRSLFNHEERTTTELTNRSLEHLLSRNHSFFARNKVGSLTGDIVAFSRSYMSILDSFFLQALPLLINFIVSLIVIGFIAPILLIPLGLLTVSILAMSVRALNRRAPYRNKRKKLNSQLNGTIADIIGNSILVRVFARSSSELSTVNKDRRKIASIAGKEVEIIQKEADARYLLLFGFQILTILLCIWLFSQDLIAIAALIFTVTYLGRITGSLFNITGFIRSIEQSFLDAAPITRIMHQNIEIVDSPTANILQDTKGTIKYQNVSFSYEDDKETSVIDDLSVTIPAGQRVGLAGHSGGGKTTFTQLLLRFSDVTSGSITIDGNDITSITQNSLHSAISYVPQDPFLFHRSLRENISYGKPNASDQEIIQAAERAYAMEFIKLLPNGLDTIVGERGVKLSGGQRQRIAIARAILKDAPILVLDEATSALDSESEKLIQASLDELMKGSTSIVIAHRLSTIAKLDRIIVLDNGKVVEDGSHQELLQKKGTYAKLWSHQSGGFIEE